jgi:hypothetical protein
MDAALEVAIPRQDRDDVQVAILDLLLDLGRRQRTRVPDADRAPESHEEEAELLEIWRQPAASR